MDRLFPVIIAEKRLAAERSQNVIKGDDGGLLVLGDESSSAVCTP
jgi:hypothetical protein